MGMIQFGMPTTNYTMLASDFLHYSRYDVRRVYPTSSRTSRILDLQLYVPFLQCVRDIIAFVFKFYTLFTHSLVAQLVVNPENGLILSEHSRMGCYQD